MAKKCLIIYSSYTGNTEKVASRFKSTFERNGWECDIFQIRKKAEDILHPPFDINDYDFLCVGSGIRVHLPYNEILNVLRKFRLGKDPRVALRHRDETIPYIKEPLPDMPPPWEDPNILDYHRKIVLGPDAKKAVVFITYAGYEFGPREAEPGAQLLALEIEHLGFKCIGCFRCPGRFLHHPTPGTFHGDIRDRPNEKDLLKAETFIEEKLEEIADRANGE
jgi:flavodoxin